LQADQLLRERSYPIAVTARPTNVHPHVAAIDPTQARKGLRERRAVSLPHGIVFVERREIADAPHPVALLRAGRERPSRAAMKSRRRRQMLIWPSRASQWIKPEGAGQQAIGAPGPTEGRL
jgi:hypothetical protein